MGARSLKFRRLSRIAVAVLAALTAVVIPSQAWAAPDGPWIITPQSTSAKCLELPHANTATGTIVDIYTCPSGITPLHMRWTFQHLSDGSVHLVNGVSGKCASAAGGTIESGVFIEEWPCSASDRWLQVRIETGPHDYYQFKSVDDTSLCMNVRGNSTANDAPLILYRCTSGSANDLFTWNPAHQ
jgi:Ricin-type beta-trefoil lectin domain-like